MTTDTPEIIDSLPYIDTAIDEDEEQRTIAMKEVDDELMIFPPDKDYLEYLPPINPRRFTTPLLEHELAIIENKEPTPSSNDLELDVLPPMSSLIDNNTHEKYLDQLKIKLEYRQRQMVNLELIKSYGAAAWEQYISEYEALSEILKKELELITANTQKVNWNRKSDQERVARTLNLLKNEWDLLVNRNRLLSDEIDRLSLTI